MSTLSPPGTPLASHDTRPRTVSALSYTSNRSRRSNSSSNKLDLIETSKDKKRLNTKADPSKALNEATPAAVALEESNLQDLRQVEHRDEDGNTITDPDRSNPTRYRFERPLDTIRSFQAAAEGTSHRRASYYGKSGSSTYDNSPNRRSGMWSSSPSAFSPPTQQPRARSNVGAGYYRNSSYGFPAQSTLEEAPGSSQQHSRSVRYPSNPYQNPIADSPMSNHSHHPSYETMTSASDENSKSTNPSSQNSSLDHIQQIRKPDDYGVEPPFNGNGYNNGSPLRQQSSYGYSDPQSYGSAPYEQLYGQQQFRGPAPPPKGMGWNNPQAPIVLTNSNSDPPPTMSDLKPTPSKRQSWIRRKFSRRDS